MIQNTGIGGPNLISPRGGVRVNVPDSAMAMGAGTPMGAAAATGMMPAMGMAQNPLNYLSALIGSGGGSNRINWDAYSSYEYEDPAMREIRTKANDDPDSNLLYMQKFASAVQTFVHQIFSRNGDFYGVYKDTVSNFHMSPMGTQCPIRKRFVEIVHKHGELTRNLAVHAAPLFCKLLIEHCKQNNKSELNVNEYFRVAELAIRNILFMEMVSWLMSSKEGQGLCYQLPQELSERIRNLESMKDVVNQAYTLFNQSSPYNNLVFEVKAATRPDTRFILEGSGQLNDYVVGSGRATTAGYNDTERNRDMDSFVQSQAEYYRRQRQHDAYQSSHEPVRQSSSFAVDYSNVGGRKDLENLTRNNLSQFNIQSFFGAIGQDNWYYVYEENWQYLKKVLPRELDQGREEGIWAYDDNEFRIVQIDLNNLDLGWTSRVLIDHQRKLKVGFVMTDPGKLLPLLNDPGNNGVFSVMESKAADVVKDGQVILDPFMETEGSIPFITVDEPIVTESSKHLENAVTVVNNKLTQNLTGVSATAFDTTIWDTYMLPAPEDKVRLEQDLPFLFKDYDGEALSFADVIRKLVGVRSENYLPSELFEFIDRNLTRTINNWFVNACGFDADPKSRYHLSVGSIMGDLKALIERCHKKDQSMLRELTRRAGDHYLVEQTKLFTKDTSHLTKSKEDSLLDKATEEVTLTMERRLNVVVINNEGGPHHKGDREPILLKRSIRSEYFELVERANANLKEGHPADTLIKFNQSNNLWLFTYSSLDRNVATLHHVSRRSPLVLLELD